MFAITLTRLPTSEPSVVLRGNTDARPIFIYMDGEWLKEDGAPAEPMPPKLRRAFDVLRDAEAGATVVVMAMDSASMS